MSTAESLKDVFCRIEIDYSNLLSVIVECYRFYWQKCDVSN